jgi:tRNA A37 methylthiotransferase MiaB
MKRRRHQRAKIHRTREQIREVMPHACIGVTLLVFLEKQMSFLETYHFFE